MRLFDRSRAPSLIACVLILGAVGFAAGFFGPIELDPDANQGPLVGIFISGPGGLFLGVLLFAALRLLRISVPVQWWTLAIASLVLATVTLYSVLPEPKFRGYIQEIQIDSCKKPPEAADEAIQYWDKEIARRPDGARPGWQQDSREMLQYDYGVVLGVTLIRQKPLRELQKPWNKGQTVAGNWQAMGAGKSYYAQYAGQACANYPSGTRAVLFNDQYYTDASPDLGWPPRKTASFLDLQTLEPVPDTYRDFTKS